MLFKPLIVAISALSIVSFALAADELKNMPDVSVANLSSTGKSLYVILEPGRRMSYEGKVDGQDAKLAVTVLNEKKSFAGAETRIVESKLTIAKKVVRTAREYLAIDRGNNNTYIFGRDIDVYKDDNVVGHDGSWEALKDGARASLYMPANPITGQTFTSLELEKSADRVEIGSVNDAVNVPAGKFDRCCRTITTSTLAPDVKCVRIYAPGVGMVVDGDLKLTKQKTLKPAAKTKAQVAATEPAEKPISRQALALVGADPFAEAVWADAINDPQTSAHDRSDLIEDLNEEGFADPKNPSTDEIPLIENRLAIIEKLAPDAMDETNAAAFAEAYKDLVKMYERVTAP